MKFVLKKRNPDSRLGRIRNITIDGAHGTARGTSRVAGHAERKLENIAILNLRVEMLPENLPDKRATDALIFEGIHQLTLRDVEVLWDADRPEPKWGSALVLRDITDLQMSNFHGRPAHPEGSAPAIRRERVTERSELP
jgi:hypothetical protein